MADPNGSFMRLLGLELESGAGPKCQRFAAIVEDGILLKLVSICTSIVTWPCNSLGVEFPCMVAHCNKVPCLNTQQLLQLVTPLTTQTVWV